MMKHNTKLAFILSMIFLIQSCIKKEVDPVVTYDGDKKDLVLTYSNILYASYSDALTKAKNLQTQVNTFIANPTVQGLEDCKTAYIASREPYGQTDGFRFYNGPIDQVEGEMNGWPLDESYIDYVVGNTHSGIIYDTTHVKNINKSALAALNEVGGETNLATGYHAIEFLLWGQDLSISGPGARPYTDYVVGSDTLSIYKQRRADYLKAIIELLIDDFQVVVNDWEPNKNNYRKTFENQSVNTSVSLILTGLGKFCKGELYGERMITAYDTQDQEDEHSCFSDQTHRDFQLGITCIENIYNGKYTKSDGSTIEGTGISSILKKINLNKATEIQNALTTAHNTTFAIQAPFDQEIKSSNSAGRARVKAAIDAGANLATKIIETANTLGVTITL